MVQIYIFLGYISIRTSIFVLGNICANEMRVREYILMAQHFLVLDYNFDNIFEMHLTDKFTFLPEPRLGSLHINEYNIFFNFNHKIIM